MADAIQQFNLIHFQQDCLNGSSAALASPFANNLCPFQTPGQAVNKNIEEILSGRFDKNQIQSHKIPYYNELRHTYTPINKIGAPISPANCDKYWTNMKESTASSPTGRHVCMYKATVTSLEDPYATNNQKRLASLILSITNCATQTGIMLECWKDATDIMLQKEEAVNNIEKLRCICLLKGDKNFALKHVARTSMRFLRDAVWI